MKSWTSKGPAAARVVLGLIFFVFGLNGFLHFIPQPPPPEQALGFLTGLGSAGYFFPLLKTVEVIAGALLLSNRWVPLALTVLAPIVVNIVAFHAFLAPGLALPLVLVALELYLAWTYRAAFRPLLAPRALPAADERTAYVPAHSAAE